MFSMQVRIPPSGLLTSWATPAASVPTAAIFSVWASWTWRTFSRSRASSSSSIMRLKASASSPTSALAERARARERSPRVARRMRLVQAEDRPDQRLDVDRGQRGVADHAARGPPARRAWRSPRPGCSIGSREKPTVSEPRNAARAAPAGSAPRASSAGRPGAGSSSSTTGRAPPRPERSARSKRRPTRSRLVRSGDTARGVGHDHVPHQVAVELAGSRRCSARSAPPPTGPPRSPDQGVGDRKRQRLGDAAAPALDGVVPRASLVDHREQRDERSW